MQTVQRIAATVIDQPFVVKGYDVPSDVPDTPHGEEVECGASNRAQALAAEGVYAVGLESGLVERYGGTYEES